MLCIALSLAWPPARTASVSGGAFFVGAHEELSIKCHSLGISLFSDSIRLISVEVELNKELNKDLILIIEFGKHEHRTAYISHIRSGP